MPERRRGLTLGKHAPLHRGHQLVIELGLSEMDEMLLIIYDAPETTVPLAVRAEWIRELYPEVRVIEAWDGPTEVGYSPELMRAHERYVIDDLDIRGITHFYSSEPYGEHMSRALGAQVRADPFAKRRYLHPQVYRDLIVNVVFLGAPSTGKTTLAERMARELDTRWMPEYGREFWHEHQVDRRVTAEQLVEIAEEHLEREDALLGESNLYLFTDTNAITTATFARYYHGTVHPRLATLADRAVTRYDLVFVCDLDIPYEKAPDRSGEANRAAFQRQVIGDLNQRNVPFIVLRGSLDERVARVHSVLRRYHKYMNVLDLFENE